MRIHWAAIFISGGLSFIALIILFIMLQIALMVHLDSQCAALGYRSSKVTWNLDRYCITRIDQTDVVVPLGVAHEKKK